MIEADNHDKGQAPDGPAKPERYLGHSQFLPYLLNRTTTRLNVGIQAELNRRSLTLTQWRVLAFLSEHDGLPVTRLADQTATDQSTLSRALIRMEAAHWVSRGGARADGRISEVRITARGRALFDQILPAALKLEAQAFRGLDRQTIDGFKRTLNALLDNLE